MINRIDRIASGGELLEIRAFGYIVAEDDGRFRIMRENGLGDLTLKIDTETRVLPLGESDEVFSPGRAFPQ